MAPSRAGTDAVYTLDTDGSGDIDFVELIALFGHMYMEEEQLMQKRA